jgi:hypothetical protein
VKYLSEIKTIVTEYSRIRESLSLLDEQAKILELQKNQIELRLSQVREDEARLIDRIKTETGKAPDFYKITQDLANEAATIH